MAFTTDYTEQCGQPADLAQLGERDDYKGSETHIGSSPVIGIGRVLRFLPAKKIVLVPLDFIFRCINLNKVGASSLVKI